MGKVLFFALLFLVPYQLRRIFQASNRDKKLIDVLLTGIIVLLSLSSWPFYIKNQWMFSLLGCLCCGFFCYKGIKEKNSLIVFLGLIFLIMAIAIFISGLP